MVVVHAVDQAAAVQDVNLLRAWSLYAESVLTTGAGDNFNAGLFRNINGFILETPCCSLKPAQVLCTEWI